MNYKTILFRALVLSFILVQVSCKKENTQENGEISGKKITSVAIDKNYQKDEPIISSEKLEVKSIIHFSKKYNSPKLWDFVWNLKNGNLHGSQELANGNMMYLVEESDEKHNSTAFVLVLDNEGKEITKQKIAIKPNSKYDLYGVQIEADNNGGFSLFLKRDIISLNQSGEETDEEKMRNRLKECYIDKLKFNNSYSGYQTVSKSMETLLFNSLQDKGVSYVSTANFSLKYLNGKIFLYGTTGESGLNEIPFIAILDNNIKLLKLNSFDGYPDTKIDKIKLNDDESLYVEGTENTGADGYYYATNKRFILNEDLKIVRDKSDKEPYESIYRGPSAPEESDEEESETEASVSESKDAQVESKKEETWSVSTFFTDEKEGASYNLKQKGMSSNKIIFEKVRSNNTALWQIKFVFPNNYEVPYFNSTKGFKRFNGDLVFYLYLTDKSGDNEKLNVAIFVINKEGRLIRQFQTQGYHGLTDFEMKESEGKLVAGLISYDSEYANGEWKYLYAFRSVSYPLD